LQQEPGGQDPDCVQQVLKDVQTNVLNSGYSKPRVIWGEAAAMIQADTGTAMGIGKLIIFYSI
jgi:hypothetical protein